MLLYASIKDDALTAGWDDSDYLALYHLRTQRIAVSALTAFAASCESESQSTKSCGC